MLLDLDEESTYQARGYLRFQGGTIDTNRVLSLAGGFSSQYEGTGNRGRPCRLGIVLILCPISIPSQFSFNPAFPEISRDTQMTSARPGGCSSHVPRTNWSGIEICDDRYQTHSTILASQIPVAHWHERIGDPTLADSIMDRLVHNAYKIELKGPSMRKPKGGLADQPKGDGQE